MKMPIWNNRELVGHASSVASAKRLLKKTLTIHPMFELSVWERSPAMQEILGLPAGYVYAISYTYAKG